MNNQTALKIVSALAGGVNPVNGETLPRDSCFHQVQVIRALFIARQALENQVCAQMREETPPPGVKWM